MTLLYMLDTHTCAFILRRTPEALLRRIQETPLRQQVISVVTYAELLYGVQQSSRKKANQTAVDALVRHLTVLDWPQEAASHYARMRSDLKKKGAMIGSNDLLIAAHARAIGATVITNNEKDFRRVTELSVENWCS
jgi:tRNA(fMet)-specific endonuclease VapC